MRIDLYTKVVLSVIAFALLFVACRAFIRPSQVSAAVPDVTVLCQECGFQGIDSPKGIVLWDRASGHIWLYSDEAITGAGAARSGAAGGRKACHAKSIGLYGSMFASESSLLPFQTPAPSFSEISLDATTIPC